MAERASGDCRPQALVRLRLGEAVFDICFILVTRDVAALHAGYRSHLDAARGTKESV